MAEIVKNFRTGVDTKWVSVTVFLAAALMIPQAVALEVHTRMQEVLLTAGLNSMLLVLALVLLKKDGLSCRSIGLGKLSWVKGLLLFLAWWLAVTAADLVGRWVIGLAGFSFIYEATISWNPVVFLELTCAWLFVGFAEEIAFRGYLQNKLKAVTGKKWLGIGLAALIFGLWHIPASMILRGTSLPGALPGALGLSLFSFLFLNLPYEWTGLLPFLSLFHGWSDFPLLLTFDRPSPVGAAAGYVLLIVFAGAYGWLIRRKSLRQSGGNPS